MCVLGDEKLSGRQGRIVSSWLKEENRGKKLFEGELGIYLVFVSVFLPKWADVLARSFWLLSAIGTSVLLCRRLGVLKQLVETV